MGSKVECPLNDGDGWKAAIKRTLEPAFVHRLQEGFISYWKARSRPYHGVNVAARAHRSPVPFRQPMRNLRWSEDAEAVEATALTTPFHCASVINAVAMRVF